MANPVWYRSLYWRFAIGFVVLLAALLLGQGAIFLWMSGRMADLFPSRSPAQFAASMATDLGTTLTARPDVDLDAHVLAEYGRAHRAFVVAMRDGRRIASVRVPPPPGLMGAASRRLGDPDRGGPGRGLRSGPRPPGWTGDPDRREGGSGSRGDGAGRGAEGFGRGDRGFRDGRGGGPPPMPIEFASIVVDSVPAGLVAVPAAPPPLWVTVRDVGPTLAIAAALLLVAGTAIAALVVIRPADRRLRGLQRAAAALGAGQAGARAPDAGRDEIASLAHTFNDMAARLEERAGALERADATRRQLLADVSHELMTPLAAIRGYVETLAMSNVSLDDGTRARYLGIVTEEAERLEQIIGDLLDLARFEGGGGEFKRHLVTVASLFDRVRRRHEAALLARGITLETQLDGDLTVEGDANRLEQALQNLVANAARHTPAGGRVALGATRQGDDVALTVDDTGPGVPPDHLPHIFNRFYKADVSRAGTTVPSGSGLGLSIVHAIVSRHGGRVTAANRADGGARFEIRLPALPSAPRQSPA